MTARRFAPGPWAAGLALACAFAFVATAAHAACSYVYMNPASTYTVTSNPTYGDLPASAMTSGWMVAAVRPVAGDDWDISLFKSTAADPACVSSLLASSTSGGSVVDFVVVDSAATPHADLYPYYHHYSGSTSGQVQWQAATNHLAVNGAYSWAGFPSTNTLITTFDADLVGGTTYTIDFSNVEDNSATVLVYGKTGTGTYYTSRPGALASLKGKGTFTAPASGNYLLVAVNDGAYAEYFYIGIGVCQTPTPLTSQVPVTTNDGQHDWSMVAAHPFWTVAAARSTAMLGLGITDGTSGTGYPSCLATNKAASFRDDATVAVVVGDFNHTPMGTYYLTTDDLVLTAPTTLEFESNTEQIYANGTTQTFSMGTSDVARVWDVYMIASVSYNFYFKPLGPNAHLLLFYNAAAGSYFADRTAAVFDVTGCTSYTAPATGYYGLVVVNDDQGTGTYVLGVSQGPCTCPTVLASGTPSFPTAPDGYFELSSSIPYWGVMATRGQVSTDDWDVAVSSAPTGNASPTCIGPILSSSGTGPTAVDFVALDNNYATSTTYRWARSHHVGSTSTTGVALWDAGSTTLELDDPYTTASMAPQDLVRVYDAFMISGQTYTIGFSQASSGLTAFVMENTTAALFAGSRAQAAAHGTTDFTYTPTTSGYHAIVIVNDGIVSSSYGIRFGFCVSPVALANRTPTTTTRGVNSYAITPPSASWIAAGVRATTTDWDMNIGSGDAGAYPNCVSPGLANSASASLSYVDFVAGDLHHVAGGTTYYMDAHQFSAAPLVLTTVEADFGIGTIVPNAMVSPSYGLGTSNLLRAFDVSLVAGITYAFRLDHNNSSSDLHLLLFRNPGTGAWWVGRGGAVLDLAAGSGTATYTAPASDVYGIVVVDDNGSADNFTVWVHDCPAVTALTSGTPVTAMPTGYFSFTQTVGYWAAVGVRSTSSWSMDVDSLSTGGTPGFCFSNRLALSGESSVASFVVGDFNGGASPMGTYYARPYDFALPLATGTVEYVGTSQILQPNAPVTRTVDGSHVLEIWDVRLVAGTTYNFYFTHSGAAGVVLYLFRNPAGEYWAPRSAFVASGPGSFNYTAPATDWYGLVVVNDNAGPGGYVLGLYPGAADAEQAAPPAVTALRGVSPNPAHGEMTIEYALHESAPVRIELLDMAGRRVASIDDAPASAGTWRVPFSSARSASGAVPPGVYFVRLEVGGRTIGERKVALIQ